MRFMKVFCGVQSVNYSKLKFIIMYLTEVYHQFEMHI